MRRFLPLLLALGWLSARRASAAPDWTALEPYHQTLTAAQFQQRLAQRYAAPDTLAPYTEFTTNALTIYSSHDHTGAPLWRLRFAPGTAAVAALPPATFHTIPALSRLHNPTNAPLHGRRIVLDPGHIGGEWARTEERFFLHRPQDRPVQEAVLNLLVARRLRDQLAAAGATVLLTKDNLEPVTDQRPTDFRAAAEAEVAAEHRFDGYPALERQAAIADAIRQRQDWLFYRRAEIAARAQLVNNTLQPDLTICLHFNAVAWDDNRTLVDDNRLVVFVHGHYLPSELADDAQKFALFAKLLEGSAELELVAAEAIARELAQATGLPPVEYAAAGAARRVGDNPYVSARNLAANRLIRGPVVFLEPYYQNNRTVYRRLQLGDYDGTREIDGRAYPSIFREYADAVARGVIACFAPLTTAP